MSLYRFTTPPLTLPRSSVRLNNLALFPASLLPYKNEWQQIANDLPKGDILLVLPTNSDRLSQAIETVADLLKADGHRVTTIPAKFFAEIWYNEQVGRDFCPTRFSKRR